MPHRHPALEGILLDDHIQLDLVQLCEVCGVSAERVIEMVSEGVVEPLGSEPHRWCFTGTAVTRVRIALRLQQDLEVNLPGAALALDLLDELQELRQRLHQRRLGG
jgi:chaperone modulatory protein CbpM